MRFKLNEVSCVEILAVVSIPKIAVGSGLAAAGAGGCLMFDAQAR